MQQVQRQLPRWSVSLLAVVAAHGALAFWALFWHARVMPVEIPPPAMLIQLEPLPAPPLPPAPAPPPPPAAEPEPIPKLAEAPNPTLAVTQPKPKPKPRPKPPKPKPEVKPEESQKPVEEAPPAPANPKPAESKPAAPQQSVASVSPQVKETWQSKLLGHLAKFKKYPPDARRRGLEGINRLRFVVDAQGNVLSYELEGGSGSASLDRATLDMIRRAQPLPPPPPELLNGGSIEVVAPFVYSLERRG